MGAAQDEERVVDTDGQPDEQDEALGVRVDVDGTTAAPRTETTPAADPCTGTRIPDASVQIGGVPVTAEATYRVTVNNFLAGGGDGFSVLTGGTNAVTGPIDLDAFTAYLSANQPVPAPATGAPLGTFEAADEAMVGQPFSLVARLHNPNETAALARTAGRALGLVVSEEGLQVLFRHVQLDPAR